MKHARRRLVVFEFINRAVWFVSDVKQINDLVRGHSETIQHKALRVIMDSIPEIIIKVMANLIRRIIKTIRFPRLI